MIETGLHVIWLVGAAVALAAGSYAYASPALRSTVALRWLVGGVMVAAGGLGLVSDTLWQQLLWIGVLALVGGYGWLMQREQG